MLSITSWKNCSVGLRWLANRFSQKSVISVGLVFSILQVWCIAVDAQDKREMKVQNDPCEGALAKTHAALLGGGSYVIHEFFMLATACMLPPPSPSSLPSIPLRR